MKKSKGALSKRFILSLSEGLYDMVVREAARRSRKLGKRVSVASVIREYCKIGLENES